MVASLTSLTHYINVVDIRSLFFLCQRISFANPSARSLSTFCKAYQLNTLYPYGVAKHSFATTSCKAQCISIVQSLSVGALQEVDTSYPYGVKGCKANLSTLLITPLPPMGVELCIRGTQRISFARWGIKLVGTVPFGIKRRCFEYQLR